MKKIAIPAKEDHLDSHFGHAKMFTVYTVFDQNTLVKEMIESGS